MDSTIAIVLFILCIALFDETSAKIGITGSTSSNGSGSNGNSYSNSNSNDMSQDAEVLSSLSSSSSEMDNCREACLQKFSLDAATCTQAPVCIKCWEICKTIISSSPPQHPRTANNFHNNQWQLRIASMIKQEFLVATHLAWEPTNKLINCLVTWEVFGGGLMGNLLTDSSNVELSLWPDTKYRVQVTCKNKISGLTVKSYPLTVDTTNAIKMKPDASSPESLENFDLASPAIKTAPTIHPSDTEVWEIDNNDLANNYRRRLIAANEYDHRFKELVLGMCAALIVFLFILTVLCASRRDPFDAKIVANSNSVHQENACNVLLNEVLSVDVSGRRS